MIRKQKSGQEIAYDAIGNPLVWGNKKFTWEAGRRLSSMTLPGKNLSFTYSADGYRTSKTVNGVTTTYYLDGGRISALKKETDELSFVYDENGSVTGFYHNGTPYVYAKNLQGDIIGIVDAKGAWSVSYEYDAWGKLLSTTGSLAETLGVLNPFRYRGYVYDDESGLYYLNSRYYDPEVGRFINADGALAGVGGDVQGYNLFAYCFNNPVNMNDPTGNWPRWITATVAVVATGVAVVATVVSAPAVATVATAVAVVSTIVYVAQSHHYDKRKAKNTDLPQTPQEADDLNWKNSNPKSDLNPNGGGPGADCHQYTATGRPNVKYVSPDGHREVIYNSVGNIVLDSRDIGTYNFSPSGTFRGSIGHFFADMLPWYLFGNDDNDPGPLANEIIRLFK